MDWIEQWFGFAPDNGDGTLELVIMAAATGIVAVVIVWRVPRLRAAALRFVSQLRHGDRPSSDG
jgi:hypothetical protein